VGHFRFRKSLGPKGLKLNVSKTGFSLTSGVPGAHVNVELSGRRKKMLRNTFSLPGTGLSYRTDDYGPERQPSNPESTGCGILFTIGMFVLAFLLLFH